MTRALYTAMVTAGLVGVLSVGTAQAQITDPVVFTTTFPFTVGNQTVPAGRYEIRRVEDLDTQVLELAGARNHVFLFFETIGTTPPGSMPAPTSEITFDKYGDRYVLKDIWEAGDITGAETVRSRAEMKDAQNTTPATEYRVAARNAKTRTTTPAARPMASAYKAS